MSCWFCLVILVVLLLRYWMVCYSFGTVLVRLHHLLSLDFHHLADGGKFVLQLGLPPPART